MQVSNFCQSYMPRLYIFQRLFIPIHTSMLINHFESRCLHFSKSYDTEIRLTKKLKKMLNKGQIKKKWYFSPVSLDGTQTKFHKSISIGDKRRADHISRLLIQHIIAIINSGELSDELANANIEIAKVRMVSDFSQVLVYWYATGTARDDEFQAIFDRSAKKLRHLITSTYIVGSLPPIQFIKDDSQIKFKEIEKRLKEADYGTGYKPSSCDEKMVPVDFWDKESDMSFRLTKDFKKISDTYVDEGLKDVVSYESSTDDPASENSPKESSVQCNGNFGVENNLGIHMRQNLYGLDREEILRKLNANRNSSRKIVPTTEKDTSSGVHDITKSQEDYSKLSKVKYRLKRKRMRTQYDLRDYALDLEKEQN